MISHYLPLQYVQVQIFLQFVQGKISSKYTSKKQLKNNYLQFSQILEVPIDQKIFNNHSTKKQKCQIMLYRYRINRQKQTKQLIGMASMNVDHQTLEHQFKKIRLTNQYDKEAFVQCSLKIQFGQADILEQQYSRISSFYTKSQAQSFNGIDEDKYLRHGLNYLNRSQLKRNNIQTNSPLSHPENNFIELINDIENQQLENRAVSQKQQKNRTKYVNSNIINKNGVIRPILIRQQTNRQVGIRRTIDPQQQLQQKHSLMEICNKLQTQNQVLMSKLQNLENKVYQKQKNPAQGLQSSLIRSNLSSNQSVKRSPMIKKNLKVKIQNPIQKLQSKQSVSTDLVENEPKTVQHKNQSQKDAQYISLITSSQHNPLPLMQSIKQSEAEYSPFLNPRKSYNISELDNSAQNNQQPSNTFSQLGFTFAGDKPMGSKIINLKFKSGVVQQSYEPDIKQQKQLIVNQYGQNINNKVFYSQKNQILNTSGNNNDLSYLQNTQSKQSIINKSMSMMQKIHSKSYSKFNSKFKQIGSIKSQSNHNRSHSFIKQQQNLVSMAKPSTGSLQKAQTKQEQFNIRITQSKKLLENEENLQQSNAKYLQQTHTDNPPQQLKGNFLLGFMNIAKQQQKPLTTLQNIQNHQNRKFNVNKNRRTLQQLDNVTQQKFRKNQRLLKRTIQQLTRVKQVLQKANQQLVQQLNKKKELTYQQFEKLKTQIYHLRGYVAQYQINITFYNRIKEDLATKCHQLETQNADLKKKYQTANSKAIQFKKIIQMNDYQFSYDQITPQTNHRRTSSTEQQKLKKKPTLHSKNSDTVQLQTPSVIQQNRSLKKLYSQKNLTKNKISIQPQPPNTARNTFQKKQYQQTSEKALRSVIDPNKSQQSLNNSFSNLPANKTQKQIKSNGVKILVSNRKPPIPKPINNRNNISSANLNGINQSAMLSSNHNIENIFFGSGQTSILSSIHTQGKQKQVFESTAGNHFNNNMHGVGYNGNIPPYFSINNSNIYQANANTPINQNMSQMFFANFNPNNNANFISNPPSTSSISYPKLKQTQQHTIIEQNPILNLLKRK